MTTDPQSGGWDDMATVLAVRLDDVGDVVLAGPAIRTLARRARVILAVATGAEAVAKLLPGVADIIRFDCPWNSARSNSVDTVALDQFAREVRHHGIRHAVIFTSQHQSALPTALLLRLAGVTNVAGFSDQISGGLLDVGIPSDPNVHEVERNLDLVRHLGVPLCDDRRLGICRRPLPHRIAAILPERYLVLHPGASAPARTLTPERWSAVLAALVEDGHQVVVTGQAADAAARSVADLPGVAVDLVGRTSIAELGSVIARADALCVGNTGAMHIAGAVGTPIVAAFPPTVPVHRRGPWLVQHQLLGAHDIGCAQCDHVRCPLAHHPCSAIDPLSFVRAVRTVLSPSQSAPGAAHARLVNKFSSSDEDAPMERPCARTIASHV